MKTSAHAWPCMDKKFCTLYFAFVFFLFEGVDKLCRAIIRLLEYLCTPTLSRIKRYSYPSSSPHPQRKQLLIRYGPIIWLPFLDEFSSHWPLRFSMVDDINSKEMRKVGIIHLPLSAENLLTKFCHSCTCIPSRCVLLWKIVLLWIKSPSRYSLL